MTAQAVSVDAWGLSDRTVSYRGGRAWCPGVMEGSLLSEHFFTWVKTLTKLLLLCKVRGRTLP